MSPLDTFVGLQESIGSVAKMNAMTPDEIREAIMAVGLPVMVTVPTPAITSRSTYSDSCAAKLNEVVEALGRIKFVPKRWSIMLNGDTMQVFTETDEDSTVFKMLF